MPDVYTPSVNTTFLPKTNQLDFDVRLNARAQKGRVFLATGEVPRIPFAIAEDAFWIDNWSRYLRGGEGWAMPTAFTGGLDNATFWYQFQRKDNNNDWIYEGQPFSYNPLLSVAAGHTFQEVSFYRLHCRAKDEVETLDNYTPEIEVITPTTIGTVTVTPSEGQGTQYSQQQYVASADGNSTHFDYQWSVKRGQGSLSPSDTNTTTLTALSEPPAGIDIEVTVSSPTALETAKGTAKFTVTE